MLSNIGGWLRRLVCRWSVCREAPPTFEPDVFAEMLRSNRVEVFWPAVRQYIDTASNPERLLKIKRELGMKGYHYMVGYIKGQRDIVKFVNRVREFEKNQEAPVRPTPIRTGGIAKRVQ